MAILICWGFAILPYRIVMPLTLADGLSVDLAREFGIPEDDVREALFENLNAASWFEIFVFHGPFFVVVIAYLLTKLRQ